MIIKVKRLVFCENFMSTESQRRSRNGCMAYRGKCLQEMQVDLLLLISTEPDQT